jgi:hypothetical protein
MVHITSAALIWKFDMTSCNFEREKYKNMLENAFFFYFESILTLICYGITKIGQIPRPID